MSGAGKSRWGFEAARVLAKEIPDITVRRIGLNFNGGTGAGSADRVFVRRAAESGSTIGFANIMAGLLLARGLLK
eukprot:5783118-Amphidinium_carterae.1